MKNAQSAVTRYMHAEARREADRALDVFRVQGGYSWHRGPWTCPTCAEEGDFEGGYAKLTSQCGCERKVWEDALQAAVEEGRKFHVADLHKQAEFPVRLSDRTFDSFTRRAGTANAVNKCLIYVEQFTPETETGLWIIGAFGAGKTHLAIAVGHELIERHLMRVRFVSAADMVTSVRGNGTNWDWAAVDRAVGAEFLILDDVGQEQPTPFSRDVLYRVITGRYEQARPTIITSNGGDVQLAERLGGAAVSRLFEMCDPVLVKAGDYRQEIMRARQSPAKGKAA